MRVFMRFLKFVFILLILGGLAFSVYYFYFLPEEILEEEFYEVEVPGKRDLKQVISATGNLKLKDLVKVGSLVKGKILVVHVKENETVQEGQLLVEIDTGLGDTELRVAKGTYDKALADLEYHEEGYKRKQQLYYEQFISDSDLQLAKRDYQSALAEVVTSKASYEQQLLNFENNKVFSPTSGMVVHVDVSKGEKVSSDIEGGELLSLAPDIEKIEAKLEINEKDIGQIQTGQKVKMVVDTYPNRVFESTIHTISLTSKTKGDSESYYLAKAYIDNAHLLLRSGMSVNATIDVSSADSALTVSSRAFLIKQDQLEPIAEIMNLPLNPINKKDKLALQNTNEDKNIQFVWAACEDCFQEIPIEVGITDQLHYEIKSGLSGDERLVVEVMEDDKMQAIYEECFRKL